MLRGLGVSILLIVCGVFVACLLMFGCDFVFITCILVWFPFIVV